MKILQISHHFLPHIGGIELYVYRLSRDIIKSGADCNVITSSSSNCKQNGTMMGIPTVNLPSFNLLPRNPFLIGMEREIKRLHPDTIHIHSIWFFASLQACMLKKKYGFQIVNTVHGVMPDQASLAVKFFLFIFKPFASYIVRKSDKIIVLSEIEKVKIKKHFYTPDSKIFVIAPGIDSVTPKETVVEEVKKKIGSKYLVFTGRIIQDKNPDVLIEAMKINPERKKELKLVYVGPIDENYKNSLLKLADDPKKVIFWGPLDPMKQADDIASLYKNAIASISIGSWEGLPVRVMESMAQGVPAIVYKSGGIKDLIQDGLNGFIIDNLNSKDLSAAIDKYLDMKEQNKKKISLMAVDTIKSYLWKSKFNQIVKLYQR